MKFGYCNGILGRLRPKHSRRTSPAQISARQQRRLARSSGGCATAASATAGSSPAQRPTRTGCCWRPSRQRACSTFGALYSLLLDGRNEGGDVVRKRSRVARAQCGARQGAAGGLARPALVFLRIHARVLPRTPRLHRSPVRYISIPDSLWSFLAWPNQESAACGQRVASSSISWPRTAGIWASRAGFWPP